jgi:hypothetical protein
MSLRLAPEEVCWVPHYLYLQKKVQEFIKNVLISPKNLSMVTI